MFLRKVNYVREKGLEILKKVRRTYTHEDGGETSGMGDHLQVENAAPQEDFEEVENDANKVRQESISKMKCKLYFCLIEHLWHIFIYRSLDVCINIKTSQPLIEMKIIKIL